MSFIVVFKMLRYVILFFNAFQVFFFSSLMFSFFLFFLLNESGANNTLSLITLICFIFLMFFGEYYIYIRYSVK